MTTVEVASRVNVVGKRNCLVKQRLNCPRLFRNFGLNYKLLSISFEHVRFEFILVQIVLSELFNFFVIIVLEFTPAEIDNDSRCTEAVDSEQHRISYSNH